jgi:hypothetical protein
MGSCVSDDVDTATDCGEDVCGSIGVDEDRFASAMSFVCGGLEGAFWKRGAARGRSEKFYAVDALAEKFLGGVRGLCGVGYFRSRELHKTHEAENLVRGKGAGRNEARACRSNFWAGDFAGLDAVAKLAGVLPQGARVEHAGKTKASERVLKLARKLGRGDVRDVGPLSFEEVDVAVPETGGDREAETVEDVSGFWKLHLCPVTDGNDFFATDEDYSVAYGILRGTDVDSCADESGIFAWRVRCLVQGRLLNDGGMEHSSLGGGQALAARLLGKTGSGERITLPRVVSAMRAKCAAKMPL